MQRRSYLIVVHDSFRIPLPIKPTTTATNLREIITAKKALLVKTAVGFSVYNTFTRGTHATPTHTAQ